MLRLLAALGAAACLAAPAATAAPTQLDVPHHVNFGNATVGSSGSKTVTLTNTSDTAVTIYSIGVSSTTGSFSLDFANDFCVGVTLAPGESCTYAILYTPIIPGRQVGTSDISYGTNGMALIKLSGHAN